jgi:glutaredoxin-like protein
VAFIDLNDQITLRQRLDTLTQPVSLIYFTQTLDCEFCQDTERLLTEVDDLSDQVKLEVHNLQIDRELAEQYGIGRVPATVILGARDYGIRYYGIPAGHEFAEFVDSIEDVSRGESGLPDAIKAEIVKLRTGAHIRVFTTPACPHCPSAARMAHKLAIESELVTADVVEIAEFPDLTANYNVMGVPKTVVNEEIRFEGAVSEHAFVEQVLRVNETDGTAKP